MPLIEYINKFYRGNQASFARLTGVQPAQVTQWINKGFIVCFPLSSTAFSGALALIG